MLLLSLSDVLLSDTLRFAENDANVLFALQVKEYLANPEAFAVAAAPAAAAAPAEAAKEEAKPEPEEESDEEMGFGLFDD